MITSFLADLHRLRTQSPLVYNITNAVAMDFTANALLAIGASPIMSNAMDEVLDLCAAASVLVLNIGTLDTAQLNLMLAAGKQMQTLGHPIVFDPVGAGASTYRTESAWQIIETCHPTIIRANASEIHALALHGTSLVHDTPSIKGVDATISGAEVVDAAQALARKTGAIVVVSGERDYITDGQRVDTVTGGSLLQTRVTAMGCAATTIVAAFAAVNSDPYQAAIHGMTAMSKAGEQAALQAQGSGSMRTLFLDALYGL